MTKGPESRSLSHRRQCGAGTALTDLLGEGEAFLLGAGAALLAADRRGALPEAAVAALVDLELPAHQRVTGHSAPTKFVKRMPEPIRFSPNGQNVLAVR